MDQELIDALTQRHIGLDDPKCLHWRAPCKHVAYCSPSSESASFEGQHQLVTIFLTFLATIRFWKTVFGSFRTFRSSADFHIEQPSIHGRSIVPHSQTC
jgi:hypothetical protein